MKIIHLGSAFLLLLMVSLFMTACEPTESGDKDTASTPTSDSVPAVDSSTIPDPQASTETATLDSATEGKKISDPVVDPKKPDKKSIDNNNTTSTGRLDKCYFKVSFISMASGPDYEAGEKLKEEMKAFEKAENVTLTSEIRRWGREGEYDYCFSSLGLTDSQREKWSKKIRKIFKGNDMVQIPK
jgi:hypothetical protein